MSRTDGKKQESGSTAPAASPSPGTTPAKAEGEEKDVQEALDRQGSNQETTEQKGS